MIFIDLLKVEIIQILLACKYPSTMWGVAKLDFDYLFFFTKMDASRKALLLN